MGNLAKISFKNIFSHQGVLVFNIFLYTLMLKSYVSKNFGNISIKSTHQESGAIYKKQNKFILNPHLIQKTL